MVIHIYRLEENAAQWAGWEAFDETGRWRGVNRYLGQFRTIFETTLHRGEHPDPDRRPKLVFSDPAYWLEVK